MHFIYIYIYIYIGDKSTELHRELFQKSPSQHLPSQHLPSQQSPFHSHSPMGRITSPQSPYKQSPKSPAKTKKIGDLEAGFSTPTSTPRSTKTKARIVKKYEFTTKTGFAQTGVDLTSPTPPSASSQQASTSTVPSGSNDSNVN